MPSGSIYVSPDEKFHGSSPQWWYEKFWTEARPTRLRRRRWITGIGAVTGALLAIRFSLPLILMAPLGAAVAAGGDLLFTWWDHERTAVWRGKRRGEVRTGRLLRRGLAKYGYSVLDGRAVPGEASIDHLVIGPGGVWIVDNEAWGPDVHIAQFGGKLFFDEKNGSAVAKGLTDAAAAMTGLLSRESGIDVEIQPVLAVHGGKLFTAGRPRVVVAEGLVLAYPRTVSRVLRGSGHAGYSEEQVELLTRTAARILRRIF
ncbi:NERD domain-containing protein [Planotetraspora sp. A-T 1434]|uniref:nuclease-related domain-containing protein n=1 Tax=Planotetraspora sp. A-T 1434 TaxID=2979219 RepID=UPI0021BE7A73|nr:nuclease-related domain-containing protein [Planotetraspora sp. A-T 1434]MCT9932722.1 NERD domain-containing protein [Planotetraspora sp. A-T 1434]